MIIIGDVIEIKSNKIHKINNLSCGCYNITEQQFENIEELNNPFNILNQKTIYDYKCLEHNYELKKLKKRLGK